MNWNLVFTLLVAFTLWRLVLEPLLRWPFKKRVNPTETLNKQIANLYTLIAFNSKRTPKFDTDRPTNFDLVQTERLDMWQKVAEYHRVGQGMSFDEAEVVVNDLMIKMQDDINWHAPYRIKNGCHGAQLCPQCKANLEKAETERDLAKFRQGNASAYWVACPPCELPYSQWAEWKKDSTLMQATALGAEGVE